MKSNSSRYLKTAALAIALLAAAGCSDDSNQGVKLECETGLVVCNNRCCDGTCENGICQTNGNENNGLCPTGFKECKGACVDHKTAHNHCGTCGHACENNETCVGGTCQADACPTGFEVCNGACVNKKIDAENCGTCGNTCGDNAYCANGDCQCPRGYSDCDNDMKNGCEANTLNCDLVCEDPSKVKCESGACCDNADECCGSACCGNDTTCCGDGICADLQTSAEHCGSCNNPCTDGKSCVEGTCERVCSGATPDLCEELDLCVNFANDALHCGNCSTRCDTTETCVEGTCTPSEVSCDADPNNPDAVTQTPCWGTCADLESDPANCGACGNACLTDQTCEAGACECPPDTELCHDRCVDYANDKDNCGSCGNKCLDDQTCSENTCVCPEGREVCGDACVDYANDIENCGSCGNACVGEETCQEGTCTLVCKNDTDIVCNGTCVDKNTSNAHCGNCDNACDPTSTCVEGTCTPSAIDCNAGLEADDPDYGKKSLCWGTCTDLSTDTKNCGVCGNACLESQICTDVGCTCPEGTTLCHDSCMTFDSDAENCGSCGNKCGEGQICEGGECVTPHVITCFGKETDILTDVNNCGACLHKCSTGETCTEGKCTLVCGDDYTLCNGACVNLQASAANCGACGKACADGQACFASEAGGYCDCETGRYDCDGLAANGCESTKPCACKKGDTKSCWRGSPENLIDPTDLSKGAKGACQPGTQICDDSGQFWGQCTGGVYPSALTCNEKGLHIGGDQNCNGVVDTNEACVTKCDLMLTDSSYIGCEYWAAYTENRDTDGSFSVILSNMNDQDANITIYKGSNRNIVKELTLPKGSVQSIPLETYGSNMLTGTTIQSVGFRIVSTQPITAYQFNPVREDAVYNDALLLLPKNVYGKQYYNLIGMPYKDGWKDAELSGWLVDDTVYIAIQATSPGETIIKIKPTVSTNAGTGINSIPANALKEFTLSQYQVFQLSSTSDLTGTEVTADKPFVAIAGCKSCLNAVAMPGDVQDHYSEQLFPYQAWGKNYALVGFQKQGEEYDQYRIISPTNAVLTITPQITDAKKGVIGGTNKINITAKVPYNIVTKNSFYLSSTEPILVAGFLGDEDTPKDPSYSLMVPVEQFRKDYSFLTPPKYNANNITIVAPSDINSVKLYVTSSSGDSLTKTFINSNFKKIGTTGWSYVYYDLGEDSNVYKLIADKPIGVQSYGYAGSTSYAYPLGLNLTKLNNTN